MSIARLSAASAASCRPSDSVGWAWIVLVMSSMMISALRKAIPGQVRISTYVVVIATFVTVADFTLQALLGTGYLEEAHAWRDWLLRAVAGDPAGLRIMYALDG